MFDKDIISLLSFLLVTGSSYIIFNRKKNNYDEVNLINNSDNLIDEDNNIDTEKSNSSLLFAVIIIIAIISVISFFIFYCKNKKKKEITEESKNNKGPKIIKNNKNLFFEEYEQFKKDQKNKEKIEVETKDEIIQKLVELFEKDIENEYNDFLQKNKMNPDNYAKNKYIIDFNYPCANDKLGDPYKEKNRIVYRFNIAEHEALLNKIIFNFFEMIKNDEYYNDVNFKSKDEEDKKNIMYFFIATIIEPFFEIIYTKKSFIFIYREDNFLFCLISIFATISLSLSTVKEKEKYEFINYALNSKIFPIIFNLLIKKYSPYTLALRRKKYDS